ncbi:GL17893 [Drosophila persimilis]|uniref:GL17893 n=1 Tax=Drosophila persimilis TaxID=7234 RepID=B4H1V3_DROPE|nr:GL17893 [Drosophila persimilis]
MPPQIRALTPELQQTANEQLHEVPDRLEADLEAFKTWIKQQPHLNSRTDDQFLVAFLRGCKFSLERAKSKLDKYYTLRTKYPDHFNVTTTRGPKFREIHQTGRHICVQQRTITMPVKTTEVYTRPTWKHVSTPCQPQSYSGQMCTRVQVVHEPAYRDVIKHKTAQQMTYDCCTGWSRENPRADACMKPVCSTRCQNGGNCTAPQTCSCPSGYTGRHCEVDVNECHVEKPCDQQCVNTPGSYFCRCRQGFVLQADQQSCKKVSTHDDDAFEARDLENDIDDMDPEVATRLQKIERSLANERVHTNELQKSLQATYSVVDTLQTRLSTLEKQAQDVSRLQTNLYKTESRTNKLEGMLNLLLKCRNGPNANCP